MKRVRLPKAILCILVFMGSFYICMPALSAAAETDVTARIAPAGGMPADSDDNGKEESTGRKSPEGNGVVGTGDYLVIGRILLIVSALALSFAVILLLRERKIKE